jgi:hypothetical protein
MKIYAASEQLGSPRSRRIRCMTSHDTFCFHVLPPMRRVDGHDMSQVLSMRVTPTVDMARPAICLLPAGMHRLHK